MTHLWSRRWMIAMLLLCTLPALGACALGDVAGTPAVTPVASTPAVTPVASTPAVTLAASTLAATPAGSTPAATPAVGAQATPAGTPATVEVVFGSGSFIFPETTAGLADLSSYKATLKLSFAGTRDGKTQQWSKTYFMLTARKPAARQLTIAKSGDLSDLAPVFMAEVNGTAYERGGTNACTATVITPGNSLAERLEPAGILSSVVGAEQAGSATVNGVAANHYTFDERASGEMAVAKSTGELWVASTGGYIVKYLLSTKGTAVYFGKGIEGTLSWDYELTGVNQPVAIELPKECLAGLVDAPLLPDATDVLRVPGLLGYSTHTGLANAVAFYQKQIPLLGWKPMGEPAISNTFALLNYTQGAQTMKVIITAGQDATTFRIVVEVGQP